MFEKQLHPLNYLLSTRIISLLVHGNVFKVLVHEVRIGHISENNSVEPEKGPSEGS